MNRLESLGFDYASRARSTHGLAQPFSQDVPFSLDFPHCWYSPEHYERRYRYPLVIWLHSDRSSELEIGNVMTDLSLRNYVAISLRGTQRCNGRGRFFSWALDETSVGLAEEMVFEAMQAATKNISINPDKIFLAGYGSGGTLAQQIALRYPEVMAGVFSCNGPLPNQPRLLSRWKQAKHVPILWMHGNQSVTCGLDAMCDMLESAYPAALNIHPMQFACGDELTANMLATANRFMMQIVTGEPISLATCCEDAQLDVDVN